MLNKKSKRLWIAIGIGVLILIFLMLLASIINLGERLSVIHPYLAYGFYVLAFLLTYILIINPIRIIVLSPAFHIETVLDKPSRRRHLTYKKVSRTLIKNEDISKRERDLLKKYMNDAVMLQLTLNEIYNSTLKKKINSVIFDHAKTVLISTAISQNGRLDFFAVITVNLRLVKSIVQMCGFRPSFKHLAKLTINVFSTALIAEGLENVNLTELLPSNAQNVLKDIPFARVVTESITQGISNALLTLRIGVITRKYLFADAKELSKKDIRRGAFIESLKMIPSVVKDSIQKFPSKVKDFFSFGKKEEPEVAS